LAITEQKIDYQKLYSRELEKTLIGCLINDKQERIDLESKLFPGVFASRQNTELYQIIYYLQNKPDADVDLPLVVQEIKDRELDITASYVTSCVSLVVSAARAENHFNKLRELWYRRQLIKQSKENIGLATDMTKNITEITGQVEHNIYNLAQEETPNDYVQLGDVMVDVYDDLQSREPDKLVGIPTGLEKLDDWTGGLREEETYVFGARPKMGKTTLCFSIGQHAAVEHNIPVAIFSIEMSKSQIVVRSAAREAEVDSNKLRNGIASDEDWQRITRETGKLYEAPIYIDDRSGISIETIRSQARRMKMEHDIELIIIDYIEKVGYDSENVDKHERIFRVMEQISAMNEELQTASIVVSQLNRKCEQRNDKRPILSDLKASSGIEQEADFIAFLYREGYYNEDMPSGISNITELIVRANRHGQQQKGLFEFQGQYNKFRNCPRDKGSQYTNWIEGK